MSTRIDNDKIFKALANATRRDLLDCLKDQPQTTGQLCEAFPVLDRCTVMQHLKVLEDSDLIIIRREGRERWNHLNPMPIKHIHDRWIGAYAAHAVDLIGRMQMDMGD
ncbi:ArsR/SmtB family transcription factor [Pararhizobium arenae]|uniref:ArsR/SmtB family transcription factor n=1 Tax=Pararhizobium arenae TaxID=1856850 RepID=UPI00094AC0AD|nr:metalloregulator ArsR/SmtB family transcription factor [Pararhizobium arenae]